MVKKNLSATQEAWVPSLDWEDLLEKGIAKFHGQRNLAGYNSWNLKESDMTE